jgi:hypothetical protein
MRCPTKFLFLLGGLVILVLPITMCWRSPLFNENYGYATRQDSRLILETPESERLLIDEGNNVAEKGAFFAAQKQGNEAVFEFVQHPEQHIPKHLEFLRAIARQAAEAVPKGTHARFLKGSGAPCGYIPDSSIYAKFRITDGPMKGHEGWACTSSDFSPTFGGM